MDKVWVVIANTESGDNYVFAFKNKPDQNTIIERIWECEGEIEDLDWYKNTTTVRITEMDVE